MSYHEVLSEAAAQFRPDIERDLADAHRQLHALTTDRDAMQRRAQFLEALLATPTADDGSAKSTPPSSPQPAGHMTLHEAMHKVILESPERRLRAGDILAEIERQGLYRMRDGRLPESQQIHARANHYPHLFEKDGSYFIAR